MLNNNFKDLTELTAFIQNKGRGGIVIGYENMPEYPGMVRYAAILYDCAKDKYHLDLQWISLGLDLFGENILENYTYAFPDLKTLTEYLQNKYAIAITDIPVSFHINPELYPNPFKNADQKTIFEASWRQFEERFKQGDYLDPSLPLVYSTQHWSKIILK